MYIINKDISYYIFDFCGTLYKGNTSLQFLTYLYKRSSLNFKIKFFFYWTIAKILRDFKIIGDNTYMKIRVKTLSGIKVENLQSLVSDFYIKILNKNEIEDTFKYLSELIKEHKNIIILSNTFHFILEGFPMKKHLSNIIGSKVSTNKGLIIGKYSQLINQIGKLNTMNNLYNSEDVKKSMFITDNLKSDNDLFSYVDSPILYR